MSRLLTKYFFYSAAMLGALYIYYSTLLYRVPVVGPTQDGRRGAKAHRIDR